MPLHRSARLFTLGLALAGTCAAQDTQENKQTQRSMRLQQKADKGVRKAQNAKPPKKADKVQTWSRDANAGTP